MSGDIASLVSGLSTALSLVPALVQERDRHKAAAIERDLTDRILQTQAKLAEVLSTIIEKEGTIQALTERLRVLESDQREKARYRLAKVGTLGDFFAYQLRSAAELPERSDEPEHFLCQPCFDAGKKGVLRLNTYTAVCPLCKTTVVTANRPPIPPARSEFSRRGPNSW